MSITHNKKLNPLSNLLINCISAKSAPQMLPIKVECTFLVLKFVIVDLRNASANCWSGIFSFLIPLQANFLYARSKSFFIKKTINH